MISMGVLFGYRLSLMLPLGLPAPLWKSYAHVAEIATAIQESEMSSVPSVCSVSPCRRTKGDITQQLMSDVPCCVFLASIYSLTEA